MLACSNQSKTDTSAGPCTEQLPHTRQYLAAGLPARKLKLERARSSPAPHPRREARRACCQMAAKVHARFARGWSRLRGWHGEGWCGWGAMPLQPCSGSHLWWGRAAGMHGLANSDSSRRFATRCQWCCRRHDCSKLAAGPGPVATRAPREQDSAGPN